MQQAVQTRSFANGFGSRKGEKEIGTRLESRTQSTKTTSSKSTAVGKRGSYESPSHDRLVYFSTCLLGHQVEVQMTDGSVFSGIFHATNPDKDFGIILKMAHLIEDGSQGRKNTSESLNKPPTRTLIIPGKELVQVIAKGVPSTLDVFRAELLREKQQELLTDSCISQSRHGEVERQLQRWVPDDDALECPELDNIFDGHWNRGWDQFEANETLFGVKSTFNEELYTTKLDKGPQMRELEKEALRIAKEIEGEGTRDLHLAEERGIQLHGNLEVDEETRFSAVVRGVDDSGYGDCEDILMDSRNDETFQCREFSSRSSSVDELQSSQLSTSRDAYQTNNDDHSKQLSAEHVLQSASMMDESRGHKITFSGLDGASCNKEEMRMQTLAEGAQTSIPEDSKSSLRVEKETLDKGGSSMDVSPLSPPRECQEKITGSSCEKEADASSKSRDNARSAHSYVRPSSSALSSIDKAGAASSNGLSRSSSVSSFSSEKSTKSTLNPHAKEFKFNPNAKSFVPSQATMRPASPVSDNSFYYPAGMAAMPHMHGMSMGIGVGPSFAGHQSVVFNPQSTPAPQPYFHPNGPQYGQQMMIGHPRQVVYMPTYPPELPYKGRGEY
ncbi:polyadenylate-binding protein-interacting protein 4 isoform X1 [Capsicum annuum]|uniref:polyadenylate-binding protein-interacting protein 4 isoform X1 n=1 Tax=Capsicum annuum TaxID=4072 RepID=UPI0007BF0344|nr:polyadenylate-binding protein-interacting protein 4 isoform X1 [Capsicum annuum]XP_047266153.1 polyadenylate-binding protein-interacting protein 4 isoform X1 [Capsicum annuum]XP_047266154.1 polyadenylate-binding protein-interacting protein 4 isoform X1 [Capsicum annuum]